MSERCALRMHAGDIASLGRLRRRSGIEVCQLHDVIWVRVQQITDELATDMRKLPGTRYSVLPDGQLVPLGSLVPKGHLPDLLWLDLAEWMTVRLDSPALSAEVNDKIRWRIVRGSVCGESNVIVTSGDTWRQYALRAPQVRLDRWAFATNAECDVVVRGEPLPPVRGVRFVEKSGIAIEAGWTCSPSVAPDVLFTALGLASGDMALLHADGSWDHIGGDDFVRATRSAVRLSCEGLADG